jgi:hypothetical protein
MITLNIQLAQSANRLHDTVFRVFPEMDGEPFERGYDQTCEGMDELEFYVHDLQALLEDRGLPYTIMMDWTVGAAIQERSAA